MPMSHRTAMASMAALFSLCLLPVHAQCDRWQQRVRYTMDVGLDVQDHSYRGRSILVYTNNSPDTLYELWFHMYFNAFRPGSEMDVRSRTIADPDERVGDRIAALKPEEMGRIAIPEMRQDGLAVTLTEMGTVLKAALATPLLPGKSTTLTYTFEGQVPVQIRRSGRHNAEGVAYSMTQWYPKLAAYDQRGWHAYPYVGREFYGVWGDFEVNITLDSAYTVAATGVLQNPHEIGHGYPATRLVKQKSDAAGRLTWRFVAHNVHDFAWAADPDFVHTTTQVPDGPVFHFFRKDRKELTETWEQLPAYMVRACQFMDAHFGKYPWPQYSFVQGGDGGMEYPMLTLITGHRRLGSLVGVSVHEFVHSWYYGVLASNEGRFPWMDEGFTEFAGAKVMEELFPRGGDPHASSISGYARLLKDPAHEPPSVHADHFLTNRVYSNTAYSFGEMFVHQLGAVVGEKTLMQGLRRYYDVCGFKHPEPIDFERVMEKMSGVELDWYFDQWINTTRKLDYGIHSVLEADGQVRIVLQRHEEMLMPVDLRIDRRDGGVVHFHIPLSLMRGARPADGDRERASVLPAWQWTDPFYAFTLPIALADIAAVTIDPLQRTADVDRDNDRLVLPEGSGGFTRP
jgi:hypothetical protein